MAKDGTLRGGNRAGSGKKGKSLKDKIVDGTAIFNAKNSDFVSKTKIKPPKKYLTAQQKDGGKLQSRQIYKETMEWLRRQGCESLLPPQLVEDYAQVTARHIQCEEYLSTYGLIAKNTSGEAAASPFHKMNCDYVKLSSQLWQQIYSVVRENAAQGLVGASLDPMEEILRGN